MSDPTQPIPIVQGITMTPAGQVTIDPKLDDDLCDLAIALQDEDDLVDVEHIVAALILASRSGHIPSDYRLRPKEKSLRALLRPHIRLIFQKYEGQVCEEE